MPQVDPVEDQGVDRFNCSDQFRPWHDAVHVVEKLFSARRLAIRFKHDFRNGLLGNGHASSLVLR